MTTAQAMEVNHFEEWRNRINQACGSFVANPLGAGFSGAVRSFRTGALNMSIVDAAQAQLCRGDQEVERNNSDHYYAGFQLQGSARMQQGRSSVTLMPGDIILIDSSQPSNFLYGEHSRQLSLILPRQQVEQSLGYAEDLGGQCISASSPLAALATRLIVESSCQDCMNHEESEAALGAVISLIRPGLSVADPRLDARDRIFKKALGYIERNIRSEELCPELLAREVGVSVRGLYRIFAEKGFGVGTHIRNRRLDLCAESLRGSRKGQKLSALAYIWGFSDPSHFCNAFKGRFGVTPGEYRRRYS